MTGPFLVLVPGLPLAVALLLAFRPTRLWALAVAPLAAVPGLLAAFTTEPLAIDLPWLMMGTRLVVDEVRAGFLGFTAALWLLAGWQAAVVTADDPRRVRFAAVFLLAMAGNLGLLVAADIVSFYTCFATMSLASWGLVAHTGPGLPRFAGRIYVIFAVVGELALLAGFGLAAWAASAIDLAGIASTPLPDAAVACLALGFCIKLGIVPLHIWLPLAHGAAPAPASAVLSGAMLKAGLFGLAVALPFGTVAEPALGGTLALAGAVSVIWALAFGLLQGSAKAVLAYSSISQMGLIAIALGAGLAQPSAWPALLTVLVVFAAHHGLAKGALFLGVPALAAAGGRARSVVLVALVVPAAILAAAPLTSGAVAKSGLTDALAAAGVSWSGAAILLLSLSGLATALLMGRALWLLANHSTTDTPLAAIAPFAAALVVSVFSLAIMPVPELAAKAGGLKDAWPLAAALALSVGAWGAMRLLRLDLTPMRPGEVLAMFQARPQPPPTPAIPDLRPRRLRALRPRPRARLPVWQTGGLAVLGMVVAFLVLGLDPGLPRPDAAEPGQP